MKYTLYHIRGHKWGMTKTTLKERFHGGDYIKKGLTINDVCETEIYYDEDVASDREKELNLRDGYPWNDSNDYRVICKLGKDRKGIPLSEEHKLKISKARKGVNVGSNHCLAKLTESDVLEIRSKYIPRVYTYAKLSKEYGVSKIQIKQILNRKRWKHI